MHPPVFIDQALPLTMRDSVRLAKTSRGTLAADERSRVTVRTAGPSPAAGQLRGVVLDQKTRAAVPFASVYLKQLGVGPYHQHQGRVCTAPPGRARWWLPAWGLAGRPWPWVPSPT
ncbi:peptidase associated/transthyretin-like domain-containing protein [Hymenobacter siberiensis]|uniref:carboxypeptidase-like regulatory domain-containing protein n=1 Tax=Hymenobacter siberiensis TaxID=2848396 RepID=UPI001C1DDA3E|nr:carboxypeptidase-like regulatory domain-containing protein [Hymenobacter siberiensis]